MKHIYADQIFIDKNRAKYETNYLDSQPASFKIVKNGYILPPKKYSDEKYSFYFGGVVDEKLNFVEESAHKRESKEGAILEAYSFEKDNIKFENKTVIYGGLFISFFGHFLVETVSRLWCWLENIDKDLDVVFVVSKMKKVPAQVWEFFDLLGLDRKKIHFVEKITQYSEIIVPTQSTIINHSYNNKFLDIYQYIAKKTPPKNFDKIYLSRTKLKKGTMCYGEDVIEDIFKKNGYKIIYPEKLSLEEQVSYLNSANEIAGLCGTAMHLAVFAKPKTKVITLDRSDIVIEEQILINQANDIDAYYISANANPIPTDHSVGPLIIALTDHLAEFFDNFNMTYDKTQIGKVKKKHLKFFINTYYQTYLRPSRNKNLELIDATIAKRIRLYFQELDTEFWKRLFCRKK